MASKQTATADMTVDEVAEALESTRVNVLLFIKRGFLKGHEMQGEWMVNRESFAVFADSEAGRSGRAPCQSTCSRAGGCGSCE